MFVDNDLQQLAMVEALDRMDPTTLFTIRKGGTSALEFLYDVKYDVDVVVTDLMMAGMDGITLTQLIRAGEVIARPKPPIEIYWMTGWPYDSSNPNDPVMIAAKASGVRKIYTKPYSIIDVIDEVKDKVNNAVNEIDG